MAVLRGPTLSIAASGPLGGVIDFCAHRRGTFCRRLRRDHQQPTAAQISHRALFRFLVSEWSQIIATNQATWDGLAADSAISPFNAFVSANLSRWSHGLWPGQVPAPPANDDVGFTGGIQTLAIPQAVRLRVFITTLRQQWGVSWHHVPTGQPATTANCIHVSPISAQGTNLDHYDRHLPQVERCYRRVPFSKLARLGILGIQSCRTPLP